MDAELAEGGRSAFDFQVDGFDRVRGGCAGRVVQAVPAEVDILRGVVDHDAKVELSCAGDLHRLPEGKPRFVRLDDDAFSANPQD